MKFKARVLRATQRTARTAKICDAYVRCYEEIVSSHLLYSEHSLPERRAICTGGCIMPGEKYLEIVVVSSIWSSAPTDSYKRISAKRIKARSLTVKEDILAISIERKLWEWPYKYALDEWYKKYKSEQVE